MITITLHDETMTVAEWAVELDLSPNTIRWRLQQRWPADKVLQPPRESSARWQVYEGRRRTVADWARAFGLPYDCVMGRLKAGWSIARALREPISTKHQTRLKSRRRERRAA